MSKIEVKVSQIKITGIRHASVGPKDKTPEIIFTPFGSSGGIPEIKIEVRHTNNNCPLIIPVDVLEEVLKDIRFLQKD
jgi:hypothetical protein